MRYFVNAVFCTLLFLCITGTAQSIQYSGDWMFTRDGNDSNDSGLEDAINNWFIVEEINYSIDLEEYAKVDEPESTDGIKLTVFYSDDMKSGTWEADQSVQFYSVKGADEYALYWLGESGLSSGDWWTGHLLNNGGNIPTISHLAVYNQTNDTPPTDPPNPVPEPATMLLFGFGLLGIARVSRRRK